MNKQEWLRQEVEKLDFKDYTLDNIDFRLDDGYFKLNLSDLHFSSMFRNYYSIEIHFDVLSFDFNSGDNEELFLGFTLIKKLIEIAEQYKELIDV